MVWILSKNAWNKIPEYALYPQLLYESGNHYHMLLLVKIVLSYAQSMRKNRQLKILKVMKEDAFWTISNVVFLKIFK